MKNPLNITERELLEELKECTISNGVLTVYRRGLRNNRATPNDMVKLRLIRNIILGERRYINTYKTNLIITEYGNLVITYNIGKKEITYIENRRGTFAYIVDMDKKTWLNKVLGIHKEVEIKNSENKESVMRKLFRFSGLFGKREVAR